MGEAGTASLPHADRGSSRPCDRARTDVEGKPVLQLKVIAGTMLLATAGVPALRAESQPGSTVDATLTRFLARPDEPVDSYRARRVLRAEGVGKWARMEVLVELDEGGFRWTVLSEEGSPDLLEKAFLTMLEKEQEAYASGRNGRASLTPANYELDAEGRESDGLVRLRLHPRRKETALVDGHILVTPDTADIVRVEGKLARGAGFWAHKIEVVRRYERLGGHRVLMGVESTVHVRFVGKIHITGDFTYEWIDGDAIAPRRPAAVLVASSGLDTPLPGVGR